MQSRTPRQSLRPLDYVQYVLNAGENSGNRFPGASVSLGVPWVPCVTVFIFRKGQCSEVRLTEYFSDCLIDCDYELFLLPVKGSPCKSLAFHRRYPKKSQ